MKNIIYIFILIVSCYLNGQTNRADYDFYVKLNDELKTITGYADVTYTNNTADTIRHINFHLYANIFKSNSDYLKKKVSLKNEGYTIIDSIFEDSLKNEDLTMNYTMAYLKLKKYIEPFQTKKIRVYFTNKVPYPYLREGWGKGCFDISQWYPKVAVYKNKQWADFQADKQSEFYNEYGNYSLTINVPENLFLFGTGIMNYDSAEIRKRNEVSEMGEKTKVKKLNEFKKTKTVKYFANNVNDFAFSLISDFKYISETRDSLMVEIACKRANYDKYTKQMNNLFEIIDYFSKKYYPYPYKKITVVDGLIRAGGGMEYPMFIVMGDISAPEEIFGGLLRTRFIEDILAHESAHQWFYLISGSNEHDEPFMDEGFATFSEISYMEDKHRDDNYISLFNSKFINLFDMHYFTYINQQTNKNSLSMNSKSTDAEGALQYINFYSKGYLVIRSLKDIMGDTLFNKAMKSYFNKFAFSHPSIDELFNHLNEFTNDIYYNDIKILFYENVYSDYSVNVTKLKDGKRVIVIKNKSLTDLPVKVFVEYSDNTNQIFTKKVDFDSIYLDRTDIKNIIIDKEMKYLDTYYHNNSLYRGLKVHFILQKPDYFKNNLYFLPMFDYTLFDKFTLGLSAYFCDVPKIEGPFNLGRSNYGLKTEIGYNSLIRNVLFKMNAYSEQGDMVRTGMKIDLKITENYFKITPSIYAYQIKENEKFKINIAYMSRTSTNQNEYFQNNLTEGNLRGLEVSMNGTKKKEKLTLKYDVFSFLYDQLFYSDIKSARIDFSEVASYNINSFYFKIGITSGFIYGERNKETSLYLFKDQFALFNSYSKNLASYEFDALYLNRGFGFVSEDTTNYKAINKMRISAGKGLFAYSDFILAGNYREGRYLIQSGMIISIADIITFEIPFYNTELGFLIKDRFNFVINISALKVM
ncbi:MAG: hypothetical protein COX48_04120 [bacterium (Candidatus Stahlbacteria) CG23_combo_of_CG06-09_8_20_14_all_34_7]|nr:MAG: hypothetical protein COX48_04120 [bacterium (Candidatus Stahlbacteria) CG23_combo_of_CG06-09_8_20_14_all_34_7]